MAAASDDFVHYLAKQFASIDMKDTQHASPDASTVHANIAECKYLR